MPTFSHFEDGFTHLQNGKKARLYNFNMQDVEDFDFEMVSKTIQDLTKALIPSQRFGIRVKKEKTFDVSDLPDSRKEAFAELGYTTYKTSAFLDTQVVSKLPFVTQRPSNDEFGSIHAIKSLGFIESLPQEIGSEFWFEKCKISNSGTFLDFGSELLGVVTVINKNETASISQIANIWDMLPYGAEIFTSFSKTPEGMALAELRALLNRQNSFGGFSKQQKLDDVVSAINELEVNGGALIKIEQYVFVRAKTEQELRERLVSVKKAVEICLGSAMIETDGVADCFFASRAGGDPLHQFHDTSLNVISYAPIFGFVSNPKKFGNVARSLVLQRRDDSLFLHDPFNPNFSAFNMILVAATGSGKSVIMNKLSEALYSDENVKIVKADVGGSYIRECEALDGKMYSISIDKPTGLNPFSHIKEHAQLGSYREYLTKFLGELIRETNEIEISKKLSGTLETAVIAYLDTAPIEPSITDFYQKSPDFERKDLLKRFIVGGLYGHVFSGEGCDLNSRYTYFNFESIVGAGSKDFAQAVLAAIMLELNMMITVAGNVTSTTGTRIFLVCDETKFFLERNREFFLFTVSNFRKLGHGTAIINQDLSAFTFPKVDGTTDESLINNSPIKIFLAGKYDRSEMKEKYKLSDLQVDTITSPISSEFREFVLIDTTGSKVGRLRLTKKERFRSTNTQTENIKLHRLMEAVPGLTYEEAITCLLR